MKQYPPASTILRLAAQNSQQVLDALANSVNAEEIAHHFLTAYPLGSTITPDQGRGWARSNIQPKTDDLTRAILTMYGIGAEAGFVAGKREVKAAQADKAPSVDTFWDQWKPGNHPAEALVRAKGKLRELLDRTGATIRDISNTSIDRIGTMLADTLKQGLTETQFVEKLLASNIKGIADNPARALTIAHTEMNRAFSASKTDMFQELGVTSHTWSVIINDPWPCEDCAPNDGVTVLIGEPFPSGDTDTPVHPNCYCSTDPVVAGFELVDNNYDLRDKSVTKSGVPGPLEVERAISRLAILPNPADPELSDDDLVKLVESPWQIEPMPTIDPLVWDSAVMDTMPIGDLYATDPWLKRKRVKKHIESMGQAMTPFRSYPLVCVVDNKPLIIDGHHRLMAMWLLGLEEAPIWIVKE